MATRKAAAKTKKKKTKSKTTVKKKKKTTKKKDTKKKKVTTKKAAKKPKKAKPKKKAVKKPKKAPARKKAVPKKKAAPKKPKTTRTPPEVLSMADFSLDAKVRRQKDVAWRMIDGEAVIITPADSQMHTLNDVGTRIWELITGDRTLREVALVLCAEFEVEKDRAEKDTLWFAECLAKKGLVNIK
jgi:hypothetical protein